MLSSRPSASVARSSSDCPRAGQLEPVIRMALPDSRGAGSPLLKGEDGRYREGASLRCATRGIREDGTWHEDAPNQACTSTAAQASANETSAREMLRPAPRPTSAVHLRSMSGQTRG